MKKRHVFLSIFIGFFLYFLVGCGTSSNPPSVDAVTQKFQTNSGYIQTIADFLISTGYENVYINNTNGIMHADFAEEQIDEETVIFAIKQILGKGEYIQISKEGNTIDILQWKGFQDTGCGIAYSVDTITEPQIQYMTELVPISDDGWFYYVSDYNAYRNGQ